MVFFLSIPSLPVQTIHSSDLQGAELFSGDLPWHSANSGSWCQWLPYTSSYSISHNCHFIFIYLTFISFSRQYVSWQYVCIYFSHYFIFSTCSSDWALQDINKYSLSKWMDSKHINILLPGSNHCELNRKSYQHTTENRNFYYPPKLPFILMAPGCW